MTTELLAYLISQGRYHGKDSYGTRIVFLLNLIRRMAPEVDEAMVLNARDALEDSRHRAIITSLLGHRLASMLEEVAAMPAHAGLPLDENDPVTKERVIAMLRPDPKMLIEVQKIEVNQADPPCDVFQVVIEDGRGGTWNETFTTEDQLNAFLRGVRATFAMSDLQKLLPDFIGERGHYGRLAPPPVQFTQQSCIQQLA